MTEKKDLKRFVVYDRNDPNSKEFKFETMPEADAKLSELASTPGDWSVEEE